jgi:CBS domain-containing protein
MADVLLVRDLMTVGVVTCTLTTPIVEIARLLLDKDLDCIAVMDAGGHAVGTVSQDELVQAYARGDYHDLAAETVMREGIPQVPPDIPVTAAVQIMHDLGVRTVFLMHHAEGISYPAAVLSYKHVLRHLMAQDRAELSDLGLKAKRESPIETFIRRRDETRRRNLSPNEE